MSAVATAETFTTADTPHLHAVAGGVSADMHTAEMNRWMLYFGIPALIAFFFVGMVFATGQAWWIAATLAALALDIFVLIWLAMSSDTNGLIGDAPVH